MKNIYCLLSVLFWIAIVNGSNAQSSRLIAKANHNYNGTTFVLQDSTRYYYSNSRGGDLTHPLNFDSSITWVQTSSGIVPSSRIVNDFGASNLLYGSNVFYWDSASAGWLDTVRYILTYNADSQIASVICIHYRLSSAAWYNIWQDFYYHNATGNVDTLMHFISNGSGSAWSILYERRFTYASSGNRHEQIDHDYAQGVFYNTNDFNFTLVPRDNFSMCKYQASRTDTGFVDSCEFMYGYNSDSFLNYKACYNYDSATTTYVPGALSTYSSFTAGGMPQFESDSTYNPSTSSWLATMNYTYYYNGYDQDTIRQGYVPGSSVPTLNVPMSRYYYEDYSVTGITNLNLAGNLAVFPNPAKDILNIQVELEQSQPFTITIYTITGTKVWSKSVNTTQNYTTSIPVNNLKTGNYLLQISSGNGTICKQLIIDN